MCRHKKFNKGCSHLYDQNLSFELMQELLGRIQSYHRHLAKPMQRGFKKEELKEWEELCKEHEKFIYKLKKKIKKGVIESDKQYQEYLLRNK